MWPPSAGSGVLLNYPEAVALLTVHRAGGRQDGKTVGADVLRARVLTRQDVMQGVRR